MFYVNNNPDHNSKCPIIKISFCWEIYLKIGMVQGFPKRHHLVSLWFAVSPDRYFMMWMTFSEYVLARIRQNEAQKQNDDIGPVGTSQSPQKLWDKTLKVAWDAGKRLKNQANKSSK